MADASGGSRLDLLRTMLAMRRLEEQVIHFGEDRSDLIRGHFHVYIGQEAAGAGACAALAVDDYLFTTHRNHGHVLAKGGDPSRILAEILGRVDGYCGGRAGTFHVEAPALGIPHTSAIVGGCLPIAAGTAYAARRQRSSRVTAVFFGDGAMEEGAFSETLNLAQLWRLPLIFFMENNSVSPQERSGRGSPTSEHAAKALSDVPRAFGVAVEVVDGTDVEGVQATMRRLVDRARAGEGPFFVESRTSRWPGSYGSFPTLAQSGDTDIAWTWSPRDAPTGVRRWVEESDPVLLYARRLLADGTVDRAGVEALDAEVRSAMERAAEFALNSPMPPGAAALDFAYAPARA